MKIPILSGIVIALIASYGRLNELAAEESAALFTCTGCGMIDGGSWNNSGGCITIVNNSFNIAPGTCNANCTWLGCSLSGGYSVTNGCGSSVWTREKQNTTCLGNGAVEQATGATWNVNYNGALACGIQNLYLIYATDPGSTCPSSAFAGWSFTCTSCSEP